MYEWAWALLNLIARAYASECKTLRSRGCTERVEAMNDSRAHILPGCCIYVAASLRHVFPVKCKAASWKTFAIKWREHVGPTCNFS